MAKDGYDFIIVGAGSAGGLLFFRLSRNPDLRVLLIEAGPPADSWVVRMPAAARRTFMGGPYNWCFATEPEPHMLGRRIYQPRGKVLGGSSSLNGMVFVRGHPRDFDGWAAAGAQGWRHADVLPFFRSMETCRRGADDYRGGSGPIVVERAAGNHPLEDAFLAAAGQAGFRRSHDYNGGDQEGVSNFDLNIDAGYRSGTARACIEPARRRSNATVLTGAHVTRIVLENGVARGVEFVRRGDVRTVRADREVIVSAGAFQSPQILMLSGIGPADHLRACGIDPVCDLPGVGENLQDHLEVHVKHRCRRGLSKNGLLRRDRMLLIGLQWFVSKSGPAATGPSRAGGFLRTDASVDYPNFQYHFWPYFLEGWSLPPDKDGYCFDVGPVRSASRGRVRLASDDPFAAPRIRLNGLSRETDLREFRDAIRITREIASRKAFDFCGGAEVAPGPEVRSDGDLDSFVRARANSAYHPCGSCRMGSDAMAVVDPALRVRGIEGLRLADASVMPVITNGNINAPTMMIGERAASLVLQGDEPAGRAGASSCPLDARNAAGARLTHGGTSGTMSAPAPGGGAEPVGERRT